MDTNLHEDCRASVSDAERSRLTTDYTDITDFAQSALECGAVAPLWNCLTAEIAEDTGNVRELFIRRFPQSRFTQIDSLLKNLCESA